jgi:hypothetical protein
MFLDLAASVQLWMLRPLLPYCLVTVMTTEVFWALES